MTTFVLIHGAWHGAWCWYKVVPLLKNRGFNVIVPDLPGHGIDRAPAGEVTLQGYADRVCEILDASPEPVILVGHSMGGLVISQAAEFRPEKVRHLVYLAAILLDAGMSVSRYVQETGPSKLSNDMIVSADQGSLTLKRDTLRERFYADCSDEDVTLAELLLTPQPAQPFAAALLTTPENYGSVPRHYIECLQDQALLLEKQRHLHQRLRCASVISLNTAHSPFFSVPGALVGHLAGLSKGHVLMPA